MKVFSAIGQWLLNHPICFASMTLAIGCMVSVFSLEIRQFLKTRPQRLGRWILKARIASTEERLRLLARLHADQTQLILYLGRAACFGFMGLMMLLLIALAVELKVSRGRALMRSELLFLESAVFYGLAVGMGFISKLLFRIVDLRSYGWAVQRLETKLEVLRLKLAPKHLPPHAPTTSSR